MSFLQKAKAYYSWQPGDEADLKELGREMDAAGHEPSTIYIVLIKTRQQDTRIGAVYATREEAEVECQRLLDAQGRLEVNETWWVGRELVL